MLVTIYPDNPNSNLILQAVDVLKNDGVIIIPTDTVYALACSIKSNKAIERVCRIKGVKLEKANFSFLCDSLSNIADFTKPFSREVYRVMKNSLPGPFTFILNASSQVPAIFKSNKKTIGIRVPDNNIALAILKELGNPLMVTSVHDDDEVIDYTTDPELIFQKYSSLVDLVIDGGYSDFQPSTVIDCTTETPEVVREGKGKIE